MQYLVGFLVTTLLQICYRICQWNFLENRLRFDRIMAMSLWRRFFCPPCRSHSKVKMAGAFVARHSTADWNHARAMSLNPTDFVSHRAWFQRHILMLWLKIDCQSTHTGTMFAARVSTSCASYGALGRWGGGGICPPPAQQARGAKQPRQNILCPTNTNVCITKFDE